MNLSDYIFDVIYPAINVLKSVIDKANFYIGDKKVSLLMLVGVATIAGLLRRILYDDADVNENDDW